MFVLMLFAWTSATTFAQTFKKVYTPPAGPAFEAVFGIDEHASGYWLGGAAAPSGRFVIKTDATGNVLWHRATLTESAVGGVVAAADGGVYLLERTLSTDPYTPLSVRMLDADGNLRWERASSQPFEGPTRIAPGAQNEVVVAGNMFHTTATPVALRIDGNGAILAAQRIPQEITFGVKPDGDGALVSWGRATNGRFSFVSSAAPGFEIDLSFVSGNVGVVPGGFGFPPVRSSGGWFAGAVASYPNENGIRLLFLKTDPDGSHPQTKISDLIPGSLQGLSNVFVSEPAPTPDGGILVPLLYQNAGVFESKIVKLNADLNVQWTRFIKAGTNPQEAYFTIKQTAAGFVLGGTLLTLDANGNPATGEILFESANADLTGCTGFSLDPNFSMNPGGTVLAAPFVAWSDFEPVLSTGTLTPPIAANPVATELCAPPPVGNCAAPLNLSVLNVRATTEMLRWRPAQGASGYELSYRVVPNGTWTTQTVQGIVRRITGLQAGKTYQWRVRAVCINGGFSSYANGPDFSTPACDAPNAPTVSDITFTTAKISWVLNGNQHKIHYRPVGTQTWTEIQANGPNASPRTLTGLTPGTEYEVAISRRCPPPGNNWSAVGNATRFWTKECKAPENLEAEILSHSSLKISWTDNGYPSHQIRYKKEGQNDWATRTFNSPNFGTLTDLDPAAVYEVGVRAGCEAGIWSEWTESVYVSIDGCPSVRQIVQTVSYLNGFTVRWPKVLTANGYTVYARIFGAESVSPYTVGINEWGLEEELIADTTYEVTVIANCGGQFAGFTPVLTAFGPRFPFLNLDPNENERTVRLSWKPVSGALGYEIEWRYVDEQTRQSFVIGSETTLALIEHLPFDLRPVAIRIRTIAQNGFSGWSPPQVAKKRPEFECGTEPTTTDPIGLLEVQPTINPECNLPENYRPLENLVDYFPIDTILIAFHFIYNPNYVNPPFPYANGGGNYLPCDNGLGGMPITAHPCYGSIELSNSGSLYYNNAYELVAETMQKLNSINNAYPFALPPNAANYVHSPQRRYRFYIVDVDQTATLPSCAGNTLTPNQVADIGGDPKMKGIFFHQDPAYPNQTRGISCHNALFSNFGIPYVYNVFYIPNIQNCNKFGGVSCGNRGTVALNMWNLNIHSSSVANNILHEAGHACGLRHSFYQLWEAPGTVTHQCSVDLDIDYCQQDKWRCQTLCGSLCIDSNNLMSYSAEKGAFTSCQLGFVHKNMEHEGLLYLKKSFCGRPKVPFYQYDKDVVIPPNVNLVWNDSKTLYGDLYIKPGATLTIRCRVHMPEWGTIVVEPGGKLVVDGGYLTNLAKYGTGDVCPQTMWNGIQVWGNRDLPKIPANQGWLVMKNGAFIENARTAVYVGRRNYDWNANFTDFTENVVWEKAGGIVHVTESTFYNNRFSIGGLPYSMPVSDLYQNYVIDSRFVADALLKDQRPHLNSYSGKSVHSFINVYGSDFRVYHNIFEVDGGFLNEHPEIEITGITAGWCSFDVLDNDFIGCARAIEFLSDGLETFTCKYNRIFHCRRNGIRIACGSDRFYIEDNLVNPGTTTYNDNDLSHTRKGIFLDGSFGGGPVKRNVVAGCKVGLWAQGVVNFDYSSTFTPPDVVNNRFKHSWRGLQTDPTFNAVNVLGLDCNVFESYRSAAWVNRAKFYGYAQNQFPDIIGEKRLGSANRPVSNRFHGNGTDVCGQNPNGGGHNPALDVAYYYSPDIPPNERPATTCNHLTNIGIITLIEGLGGYSNPECLAEVPNGMPTADNDPSEVLDMMAAVSSELRAGIAQIYNSALADAGKWTEMRTFVSSIPDGFARYWEAEPAIADNNFARARTALNAAPEIDENAGIFKAWLNLKLNLAESGRAIPQATPVEVSFVENQLRHSPFSGIAKAFLQIYDGRRYELPVPSSPDSVAARRAFSNPDSPTFTAYPNPAKETVTVAYALQENENARLVFTDAYGKTIMRIPWQTQDNRMEISLNELSEGIYFIRLYVDEIPLHHAKLFIQK